MGGMEFAPLRHSAPHLETSCEPFRCSCSGGAGREELLIGHHDAALDRIGIARWLASCSELVGVIQVREPRQRLWRRIRREVSPVGPLRFLDVLAYRAFQRVVLAAGDRAWEAGALERLRAAYPPLPPVRPSW